MFCLKSFQEPSTNLYFILFVCSLNGLQTIATVEINFRIICFIKILQPPLGWQNLDRTIAYTRFHRKKVEVECLPPPPPITLIE